MTDITKQLAEALRHIENAATDLRVQRYEIRAAATEALAAYAAAQGGFVTAQPEPNEEREIWQAWSDSDGYSYWDTRDEAVLHDAEGSPVRFVPAEQPKGEPLTDEQITQGWACECEPGSTFDAFSSGVAFAEWHHGIGASEGDGNAG